MHCTIVEYGIFPGSYKPYSHGVWFRFHFNNQAKTTSRSLTCDIYIQAFNKRENITNLGKVSLLQINLEKQLAECWITASTLCHLLSDVFPRNLEHFDCRFQVHDSIFKLGCIKQLKETGCINMPLLCSNWCWKLGQTQLQACHPTMEEWLCADNRTLQAHS